MAKIVEELNLKMIRLFFQNNVAKNKTKMIAAGTPETAAMCNISLWALSTVLPVLFLIGQKTPRFLL